MSGRSCSIPSTCAASRQARSADRTRWAPPAFLPPSDDPGRFLINLEELPEGASLIACGNRETDRGVVRRMPTR